MTPVGKPRRHFIDDTRRPEPPAPMNEGLFAPVGPAPLSHRDPQSIQAAASLLPRHGSMQHSVLRWVLAQGPATCDAIEAATGWNHQTVAPRLLELEREGLVERIDARQRTRSGRWARPYTITRVGRDLLMRAGAA